MNDNRYQSYMGLFVSVKVYVVSIWSYNPCVICAVPNPIQSG